MWIFCFPANLHINSEIFHIRRTKNKAEIHSVRLYSANALSNSRVISSRPYPAKLEKFSTIGALITCWKIFRL